MIHKGMICPECGKEFQRTPKMAYNRKYCTTRCYATHSSRTQAMKRRKDPEKLALDVARNQARVTARIKKGLCGRCGEKPTEGARCDNCREQKREYNARYRRN